MYSVHRALADAKKAIDALKTKAQAEEEANSAAAAQALEDAKATAKTELANYKKDEVYRAAEQTAVRAAKADGREAIDAATAIGEGENPDAGTVAKALKDAKAEIDKIKTAAELDLEDAKATAIAKVNTVDASEYVTDDQNKVTTAKTTAITAINAATAVGDSENPADGTVEKALADFNEAISACKTQKETDEQALADAKAEAKKEAPKEDKIKNILDEEDESEYTDYRKYFTYDMEITSRQGGEEVQAELSRKQGSASGGEKQTPYFIILAASLMQCYPRNVCCARLAFIDEAFSAMSPERIEQMVRYFNDNGFQVIYSAPPEKIGSIGEHVGSIVSLVMTGRYTNVVEGLIEV